MKMFPNWKKLIVIIIVLCAIALLSMYFGNKRYAEAHDHPSWVDIRVNVSGDKPGAKWRISGPGGSYTGKTGEVSAGSVFLVNEVKHCQNNQCGGPGNWCAFTAGADNPGYNCSGSCDYRCNAQDFGDCPGQHGDKLMNVGINCTLIATPTPTPTPPNNPPIVSNVKVTQPNYCELGPGSQVIEWDYDSGE